MDEATLIKVLSSLPGGVALAAVLVLVLYRVMIKVIDRSIAALDRVATAVDKHTEVDIAHHNKTNESIIRLDAKIDTALGMTPTGGHPRQDPDFDTDRPPSRPRRRIRTPPKGHEP